jgi:hypothetical protein
MIRCSVEEFLKAILEKPFEEGWDENGEPPLCILYQEILKIVKPFDTFLEVGPGFGDFSLYLLSLGKKVEMLDIKENDLIPMKKICEEKGYNYIFHLQNTIEIVLNKTYDVVFAAEVIEHIEDYKKAIFNMIKLAKHKVILTTPVGGSFYSPDHKHCFSAADFKFIDKPYKIRSIATKKIDISTNKRAFLIEINI